MDQITIKDLEVFYRVGVTAEERAQPQRLLLTIELEHPFAAAVATDDLEKTINYYSVAQRLLRFGETRAWNLIETAAVEITRLIMDEFKPQKVSVEVKKFVLAQASYVSVRVNREG
jgi:dihydroneopterin aldolase